MSEQNGNGDLRAALRDRARIDAALAKAVQNAVRRHKLLGEPIVIWRDGKVVIVPPEEIEVEDTPSADASAPRTAT